MEGIDEQNLFPSWLKNGSKENGNVNPEINGAIHNKEISSIPLSAKIHSYNFKDNSETQDFKNYHQPSIKRNGSFDKNYNSFNGFQKFNGYARMRFNGHHEFLPSKPPRWLPSLNYPHSLPPPPSVTRNSNFYESNFNNNNIRFKQSHAQYNGYEYNDMPIHARYPYMSKKVWERPYNSYHNNSTPFHDTQNSHNYQKHQNGGSYLKWDHRPKQVNGSIYHVSHPPGQFQDITDRHLKQPQEINTFILNRSFSARNDIYNQNSNKNYPSPNIESKHLENGQNGISSDNNYLNNENKLSINSIPQKINGTFFENDILCDQAEEFDQKLPEAEQKLLESMGWNGMEIEEVEPLTQAEVEQFVKETANKYGPSALLKNRKNMMESVNVSSLSINP